MGIRLNCLTWKDLTDKMKYPGRRLLMQARLLIYHGRISPIFPLAFIAVTILSSCQSNTIIDESVNIPRGIWKQEERVRFEVPVQDTAVTYRFFLNIRNSVDYGYSNVYVFILTRFPDGRLGRDTVECILADREGKWLGKGISNLRDNQVLLRRGLRFPGRGTYVFEIEQAMREKELEGIKDIGIRIEKEFKKFN